MVIVGAGFAGYNAARGLQRYAPKAEIVLINPTDYFLYLPLLPEVAAGQSLATALVTLWPKVASYAVGFIVIGTLWVGHHYQFHYIRRVDRAPHQGRTQEPDGRSVRNDFASAVGLATHDAQDERYTHRRR